VTFEVADLAKQPDASYDVVSTFDVIHDMADPMAGLKSLRHVVKDDGIFVLMEVVCEEDPADNVDPMAVVKLGSSIHFCMTTSLAQGGLGRGTVGLPEDKAKEFSREAGFTSVRRLPVEHPLNVLYETRP
jgi:SAM-dependent methyltransferase